MYCITKYTFVLSHCILNIFNFFALHFIPYFLCLAHTIYLFFYYSDETQICEILFILIFLCRSLLEADVVILLLLLLAAVIIGAVFHVQSNIYIYFSLCFPKLFHTPKLFFYNQFSLSLLLLLLCITFPKIIIKIREWKKTRSMEGCVCCFNIKIRFYH